MVCDYQDISIIIETDAISVVQIVVSDNHRLDFFPKKGINEISTIRGPFYSHCFTFPV